MINSYSDNCERLFSQSGILKLKLFSILWIISVNAISQNLIDEAFNSSNVNWKGVGISGNGSFSFTEGKMVITPAAGAAYGVYNTNVLTGHFYAEVDFTTDDNIGLALFNADGGEPDLNNFTMLCVDKISNKVIVQVKDKQNGAANVLDNTHLVNKALRYRNTLDGLTYSVPFTSTNKKIRVLRHANEKFFHFYYQVTKNIKGKNSTGWAELSPSKEWPQLNGSFYMGLIANGGQAVFDNAKAVTKSLTDQDDTNSGFAATWREMNWSGYFGKALVVTFNKIQAPLTAGSRKFVFWSELNYVPAWFLDNSTMYTYEFVETWGGGSPGCHEPMSDRLLRYSTITLEENTSKRKVVHWQYVLHDPDYKNPDDMFGSQVPEVDEYYYLYPDGTIIRKIQYKPKLDTQFRNWHELTECIVIAGNNTKPSDHLSNPSLSIWAINGDRETYYPTGRSDYNKSKNEAVILAVHFINHPDVYNVFSDNPNHPDTYSGYPIHIYKTWHNVNYGMTHWPISKEQYWTEPFKNNVTWPEQVNHASLGGAGIYEGADWNDHYRISTDGRKYREFLSLMSLSTKGKLQEAKDKTLVWLNDPPDWKPIATIFPDGKTNSINKK